MARYFINYLALEALIEVENESRSVNMAALFDHEECGSDSPQGAGSPIVFQSLYRIFKVLTEGKETSSDNFEKTIQNSFLISARATRSRDWHSLRFSSSAARHFPRFRCGLRLPSQ